METKHRTPETVTCGDCGAPMKLRDSRFGPFYGCTRYPECNGKHGAHPDGSPLGIPQTQEVREARIRAHAAFDPLWQSAPDFYELDATRPGAKRLQRMARDRCYRWLAHQMLMRYEDCHIGRFGKDECERVLLACQRVTYADVRRFTKAAKYGKETVHP